MWAAAQLCFFLVIVGIIMNLLCFPAKVLLRIYVGTLLTFMSQPSWSQSGQPIVEKGKSPEENHVSSTSSSCSEGVNGSGGGCGGGNEGARQTDIFPSNTAIRTARSRSAEGRGAGAGPASRAG